MLFEHEQVEEHRNLGLAVCAILLHDIKFMLVGIPFRHDFFIGLFLLGHRAHLPGLFQYRLSCALN